MTEQTSNPAEPAQNLDPAKPTPGEYLRKLREEKGYTHAAVGEALHLTGHYIRALESDDYGKLPGLTFVKGYLRSYARFLGADVERVVAIFDDHIAGLLNAGEHTERVQRSRRRQDQALRWAIGAGFVVVFGLVAGWWFMSGDEAPDNTSQASAPVVQPSAATRAASTTQSANTPVPPRNSAPLVGAYTPATTPNTGNPLPAQMPGTAAGTTVALLNQTAQQNSVTALAQQTSQQTAPQAVPQAAGVAATVTSATPVVDTAVAGTEAVAGATAEAADNVTGNVADNLEENALTITPDANGARLVSLVSTGEDELRVTFNGNSWIEVDDGRQARLYSDMLGAGDTLTIRGAAPFYILLGDATNVAVSVNANAVDISPDIRDDSTARLMLGATGSSESITSESRPPAESLQPTESRPPAESLQPTESLQPESLPDNTATAEAPL